MSKYTLYPYDGKDNVNTEVWAYLWIKMEEQGLTDVVFSHGEMKSVFDFIAMMKSGKILPVLTYDTSTGVPVAFGWLSHMELSLGFGHFVFLRELWGTGACAEIHRDIFDYWFNTLGLNLILGLIPSFNTHAIKFAADLGSVILGPIPHLVNVGGSGAPGVLGYITKEMFNGS